MLRDVHLHGALGKRFGRKFRLDVETAPEAIRALSFQIPGFREEIARSEWVVIRGAKKDGERLSERELGLTLGERPLHIVPAPKGAKSQGTTKVIIGVALIAAAVVTGGAAMGAFGGAATATSAATGAAAAAQAAGVTAGTTWLGSSIAVGSLFSVSMGQIAMLGVAMTLAGISMLTAPQVRAPKEIEQRPSYLLSGPINTDEQGTPVPLVYGRCIVGSVLGSADVRVEEYAPNAATVVSGKTGMIHWIATSAA